MIYLLLLIIPLVLCLLLAWSWLCDKFNSHPEFGIQDGGCDD